MTRSMRLQIQLYLACPCDGFCLTCTAATDCSFQFFRSDADFISSVYILVWLPSHDDVIFCRRGEMKSLLLVRAPTEIRRPVGVTSVNKQELWRTVFGIVWGLFFANLGDIPEMDSTI